MQTTNPHPGFIERRKGEGRSLFRRAAGIDGDALASKGHSRSDRSHARDRRDLQADALRGTVESQAGDCAFAQCRATQLLFAAGQGNILRAEDHLNPAVAAEPGSFTRMLEDMRPDLDPFPLGLPQQDVGRTKKRSHEFGLGMHVEIARCANLHQSPVAHDANAVGQVEGFLLVMGHQDGCHAQLSLDVLEGAP